MNQGLLDGHIELEERKLDMRVRIRSQDPSGWKDRKIVPGEREARWMTASDLLVSLDLSSRLGLDLACPCSTPLHMCTMCY
eukprot:966356-Amorphochlora_amoeboformis.AAC.1